MRRRPPRSDGGPMAVVAALLCSALSACSSSSEPPSVGPLQEQFDGIASELCLPSSEGETSTFGDIYVEPAAGAEITFTDISLKDVDGLELVGASIAPARLELVLGGRGFPPTAVSDDAWARTRPLEGAVLGDETEAIMLGIRLDGPRGRADTIVVGYEVDGTPHTATIDRVYELRPAC